MQSLNRIFCLSCLFCLAATSVVAQDLVIRGGTIHTLAGPDIPNGTVLVQNGRIAAVGANVETPTDRKSVV